MKRPVSKGTFLGCIAVLLFFVLEPTAAAQSRDRSFFEDLVDTLGSTALAMAWPTATYESAEFSRVSGDDIIFVVYGKSGWTGGRLWLEVVYSMDTGKITWGNYNGFWPPGTAGTILNELLSEQQAPAPQQAAPTGDVTISWTITDGCRDGRGIRLRFFDMNNDLIWPNYEEYYILQSGGQWTYRLAGKRGAQICFGAEPDISNAQISWGVDTDRKAGCKDCCYSADNISVSRNLICD